MVAVSAWPLFWRLSRLGTLHRENSLTVRSAGCTVPGEGWACGSFRTAAGKRGWVSASRAGEGRGERPKGEGEQEGLSGLVWLGKWKAEHQILFFDKSILQVPCHTVQRALVWEGGCGEPWHSLGLAVGCLL